MGELSDSAFHAFYQGSGGGSKARPVQREIPLTMSTCLFYEGKHYPGNNCPHDESGNEKDSAPTGWTVQQ